MKVKGILILLCIVSRTYSQNFYEKIESIKLCDYKLENVEILIDEPNKYRRAILSPDADKILLLGKEKTLIMDLKTKKIINQYEYYFDGQWINNTAILFQVERDFEIQGLNSNNYSLPIPELEYKDNHILIANNGNKSWTVADIEESSNLFCYGNLFSKDFKKVIISTNSSESYIYQIDGSGLISKVDFGLCTDWSNDNQNVILFLDLDYGEHYTVSSDIYIHNVETSRVCKLTDSKDILEVWPSWSKNKVTFINEKDEKVYIADIIKK